MSIGWIGILSLLFSVLLVAVVIPIARRSDVGWNQHLRFPHRLLTAMVATAVVATILFVSVIYAHAPPHAARRDIVGLMFVAVFSGLVGFTELAQRYRDGPLGLATAAPALVYIYINMAAGIATYALVAEFGTFDHVAHGTLYRVLLASFGAIAFFRSSFFTARIGNADVDVGPATLLKGLLAITDQLTDRWQAASRVEHIALTMAKIDYDKAANTLSALCLSSMQGLTAEEQSRLGATLKNLPKDVEDPEQRSILLGVYLNQIVGPKVLATAVRALGDRITRK